MCTENLITYFDIFLVQLLLSYFSLKMSSSCFKEILLFHIENILFISLSVYFANMLLLCIYVCLSLSLFVNSFILFFIDIFFISGNFFLQKKAIIKKLPWSKIHETFCWKSGGWTSGQIKRTNWKAVPVQKLTEKAFWTKETISDTYIHFC